MVGSMHYRDIILLTGRHRYALVVGKADEAKAISVVGNVFLKYFIVSGTEEALGKVSSIFDQLRAT